MLDGTVGACYQHPSTTQPSNDPMTPRTQAIIDDLDFRASRLELEHAAKKDIIVTSHASRVTKRQASAAAREARSLRRQIRNLILKQYK